VDIKNSIQITSFLYSSEVKDMSQEPVGSVDDSDAALARNESLRSKLIAKVMPNDQPPGDLDSIKVVASLLNDSDRQILSAKKIKADAKVADKQAQAASIIALMLNDPAVRAIKPDADPATVIPAPALPDDLPLPTIVPGELDIGGQPLDYKSFTGDQP
jgi:hypothetical protein